MAARFDNDVVLALLTEPTARDWWDQWRSIRCPTLLVRGERGFVDDGDAQRMTDGGALIQSVSIPVAGHDVHLDEPTRFNELLVAFLPRRSSGAQPENRRPAQKSL